MAADERGLDVLVCGGALPPPPTPPAGACGTRSRLVSGWMVWLRGAAGHEGGGWRRDCHPGGSHAGGFAPRKPPGNGARH